MTILTPNDGLTDPLHAFMAGAFIAGSRQPVPLVGTQFDVVIAAGVAVVTMTRRLRNIEAHNIEATLTFPIPVHAVLFDLQARIDGRLVRARAERRDRARRTYEDAIDRGKAAVLHEELLRGVHMVSAHIAPGAEIEVRAAWCMTLTLVGGRALLRIPLTVGDIYGRPNLPDCDDLAHGGDLQTGDIAVTCRDGAVTLGGRVLGEDRLTIPLDAPIDIEAAFKPADLAGHAADGRKVVVRVEPSRLAETAINIAAVIDHSGSMDSPGAGSQGAPSKHAVACTGLATAAARLGAEDRLDLWEFNDRPASLGRATGARAIGALVERLTRPSGGTEIGAALAAVVATSDARDVLLVTDGKSHQIDVQALARSDRRFTVVLVGEDSLEANVGHLAALTGGEAFVAGGIELASIIEAAIASLRAPRLAMIPISGAPERVAAARAGMTVTATWQPEPEPEPDSAPAPQPASVAEPDLLDRAVAALAASLALPALAVEAAAALAAAEGLVTHLTSLVLVDEASTMQPGVPAHRKIALPTPRTGVLRTFHIGGAASAPAHCAAEMMAPPPRQATRPAAGGSFFAEMMAPPPPPPPPRPATPDPFAMPIDWGRAPASLLTGDLSGLDPAVANAIRDLAASDAARRIATDFGLDPVLLIIALLARMAAANDRSAQRIARTILHNRTDDDAKLDAATRAIRHRTGVS